MTPQVNALLDEIRSNLEETWGPEAGNTAGSSGDVAPGDLGAVNDPDVEDEFEKYVGDIVDRLMENYEIDEDAAIEFIFDCADDLEAEGTLPPLPEGDDDEALAIWLGKAKTAAFGSLVLQKASDEANEAE